jgi:hypothetical protein
LASAPRRSTRAAIGPCSAERRRRLGHVLDVDAEPGRILRDPPQRRIGRCPAKPLLIEPRHGAIVDHHAVLIAPQGVEHLADVHGADVRVITRSTRREASGPVTMYLNSGEISINAAALRIALYSCS